MLIELWVRTFIDAAHSLEGTFPGHHQCAKLHGHRYEIRLVIASESEEDVLVDYHELHAGLREIVGPWEHQNLNEIFDMPTTCENLAREVYRRACVRWPGFVARVSVDEQRDAGCTVVGRPAPGS